MRYFYRVRTHETNTEELPEVPITTSPTITTCQPMTDVKTNEIISDKTQEINSTVEEPQVDTTTTTPVTNPTTSIVKSVHKCYSDKQPKKSDIKVKIDVLKKQIVQIQKINGKHNKSVSEQSNKNCDTIKIKSDKLDKVKCGKVKKDKDDSPKIEHFKLKFDLSKENSVSIIKSDLNDSFSNKSDKKDKTNGKKSPIRDKKSTSPKDKKSPSSDKKSPSTSDKKSPIILNFSNLVKSEKSEKSEKSDNPISKNVYNFENCKIKVKDDKQLLANDKQKSIFSRENSINKLNMSLEDQMEEQKSEFLNSFELTARKSLSPAKTPVATPSQTVPKITLSKRKNKEPMKSILKRNRYSDEEDMKDIVEYKIKEEKTSSPIDKISFSLSPFPIGSLSKETFVKPPTPNGSDKRSPKEKDSGKFKVPKTESFSSINTPPRVDTPRPITKPLPQPKSSPVTSMKPPQIPLARKLTPILPKTKKETDLTKLVKKIEKEVIKNKVVYGPGMDPSTLIQSYSKPNQKYLNYALINSANKTDSSMRGSSTPYGNRTPRYAPNSPSYSPIYSPDSPQYNPNYNIPSQPQFKYIKSAAYVTNYLQNLLTKDKSNDDSSSPPLTKTVSPPPPPPPIINKPIVDKKETIVQKRLNTSPISIDAPPEKQKKVQSLLDSCNMKFPSSLSITLATEEDEPSSNTSSFNPKRNSPVNNFIEIVKLSGSGGGSTGGIGGSTNDDDKIKKTVLGKAVNGEDLLSKVIDIKNKLNEENKLKSNEISNNNNIDDKADSSKNDSNSYQFKFMQSLLHQEKINDNLTKLFPNEPTKIRGSPSPPNQQFVSIAPRPESKILTPPPTTSSSSLPNILPLPSSMVKKPTVKKAPSEPKIKKEKPKKKAKNESALDLSSSIPNNSFTSPKSSPHEITPEMHAYVNEMARMAQNSRFMIPQMPNNYMPNYNLNMQNVQQLMMMEQYTRMQKAGAEAMMETYVQNLKKANERKEV